MILHYEESRDVQLPRLPPARMYQPRARNLDSTIEGLFGGVHQSFVEAALNLLNRADVAKNEGKRIQVDLTKIAFMLLNLSGRLVVGFRTQVGFDFLLELANVIHRSFRHDGKRVRVLGQDLLAQVRESAVHSLELCQRLLKLGLVLYHSFTRRMPFLTHRSFYAQRTRYQIISCVSDCCTGRTLIETAAVSTKYLDQIASRCTIILRIY
jgi:hypothetical protein